MTVAAQYDRYSKKWAPMLEQKGFVAAYSALFDKLQISVQGRSVCDLGTGSGDFAMALARSSSDPMALTVVDPSGAMLRQAVRRLAPYCDELQAHCLRLEDYDGGQGHDIVLAAHVLEHCPDPLAALHRMFALLRPGGIAILSVSKPHVCQWLIWLRWRHRWFSEPDLRDMCSRAGFSDVSRYGFPAGIPRRVSHAIVARKDA